MRRRGGVAWALFAVVMSAPGMARAQDIAHPPSAGPAAVTFAERQFAGFGVVHDNDNLPHPFNTLRDDNYSAAYEFRVDGRIIKDTHLTWPLEGLDWLTRVNRLHARGSRRYHSARLAGLVYTPDRIETPEVQTDDRPYASLVALTAGRTSVGGPSFDRAWSSELSIGMLGLELPGDVQRMLHRTRRWMTGKHIPYDPLGWGNQISAGGEPTALYRVGHQRRLAGDGTAGQRKHWEVVGSLEGSVGYSVDAAGSLSMRAGAFTSEFWESPRGIASPAVAQQASPASGVSRWDVFAFGLVRPRVVAYDALLQGQFRRSVHTVPPRHVLGEWEGGIGTALPAGPLRLHIVIQFAQGRTADYVGPKARRYTWGTVGLFLSRPTGHERD